MRAVVVELIDRYYPPGHAARAILVAHSAAVAELAVRIARHVSEDVNVGFVEEAAWLHDIGIGATHAPQIGCQGSLPYICHGVEGRKLLDAAGLHAHGLVCERHIGVGLSAGDIRAQDLPLPERDMQPLSLEEQIVTYADLFFSKNPRNKGGPKNVEQVRSSLARHGPDKVAVFDAWHQRFVS